MTASYPWNRLAPPWIFAPSPTGAPIPGALLYFYVSGNPGTPLDTFADPDLQTPNSNPVVANQYGVFPPIFLQNEDYLVVWTDQNAVEIASFDPVAPFIPTPVVVPSSVVLEATFDGNGQPLVGGKTGDEYCPLDVTIDSVVLMADQAGTFTLDIWVNGFVVNTPPNILNSIVASDPPNLADTSSYFDSELTGWVINIAAGSQVRFVITASSTVTRVTAQLNCVPTT